MRPSELASTHIAHIDDCLNSLTDENIRKNWELYGHPDGRQEVSMGIALPKWIVESSNNIWVLGAYGILFGGALPALVVRICSSSILSVFIKRDSAGSLVVRQP